MSEDSYNKSSSHSPARGNIILVKIPSQAVTTSLHPNSKQAASMQGVNSSPLQAGGDDAKTSFLVSFHKERETGDLIETRVSSNNNHVTARSVNSPQDIHRAISQDLNQHHTPGTASHTTYEYNHAPFRAADPYTPFSLTEGQQFLSGTVLRHHTGVKTMSDLVISDNDARRPDCHPVEVKYQNKNQYEVEVESSKGRRSPPSPLHVWGRVEKPTNDFEPVEYFQNATSTIREGGLSPTVKLSSNSFMTRAKSQMGKYWSGRSGRSDSKELLEDGEFILERSLSRHEAPSVFIAVPVNSKTDKRRIEEMDENNRRRELTRKKTFLLPRSRSLSHPRRIHIADEYTDTISDWNSRHDHVEPRGDALYIGDDGHLYTKNRKNNFPRDDNFVLYSPPDVDEGTDKRIYSFEDFQSGSSSHEGNYYNGEYKVKSLSRSTIKEKQRGVRPPTLSRSDFRQTIPIYTHRRHRKDVYLASAPRDRFREGRRRQSKHKQASLSSYSDDVDVRDDDDDDDYNNQGKNASKDTPRHQTRQRKPDVFSENRENVSSIHVTSLNEREANQYPLGMISPNTYPTNFTLFPSLGFPPSLPNQYTGFPYSPISGHMDQLVRNSNLTYTNMRSYLDAMGTSLANIPASTISASPYISQQLLQQHSSDPMENVEALEFFKNANPMNSDARSLEAPVARTSSWSERQQPFNKPSCIGDAQKAILNDWRDGAPQQRGQNEDPATVTELMPSACKTTTTNTRSVSQNIKDIIDRALDIPGSKPDHRNTAHNVAGENHLSVKPRQIQFSEETKSGTPENTLNNSAFQTDSGLHRSSPGNTTPTQPPPARLENVPPPPEFRGFHLKRSTSRDIHTQTLKSPPPATLPKPKSTKSPEPCIPSHQTNNDHLSNTSPDHDDPDLLKDDLLQPLGSSFFAISNMTVMDLPESAHRDLMHSDATHRDLMHSDATHRDLMHSDVTHRDLMHSDVTHRDLMHSDATHRDLMHSDATHRDLMHSDVTHRDLMHSDATHRDLMHSDVTYRDLMHSDVTYSYEKNLINKKREKCSTFADDSEHKYSSTQLISSHPTHPPISVHPDADYDVYPRKSMSTNASANSPAGNSEMVNGDHLRLMTPRSVHSQPSGPRPPLDNAHLIPQVTNSLSHLAQVPVSFLLSAHKSLPDDCRSRSALIGQHRKASTNPSHSPKYPQIDLISEPKLLKSSQPVFLSHHHSPSTLEEVNISPCYLPRLTYKSLPHSLEMFSGSSLPQRSQKIEEADRNTPYQFYKGDPAVLAPATTKSARMPDITQQFSLREEATCHNATPAYDSRIEYGSDTTDTGYIFYKGPNLVSMVPKEVTVPVLDQAQNTPLVTQGDITNENLFEVSAVKLESTNQLESATPLHGNTKSLVPIPPRDFDSSADSSEYIYTSKGWSHMADTPTIVTAMFCTGVEDNSTRYMEQLYRLPENDPDQNTMHAFFRDSLPKDTIMSSLTNINIAKTTQICRGPLWNKLSIKTMSMKLSSDLDLDPDADTAYFFNQHRRLGADSPDLDSGVSLASQISRDSFQDVHSHGSDELLLPAADYPSDCSNTSCSSMELGWDYLSCNKSVKEKEKREDKCDGARLHERSIAAET